MEKVKITQEQADAIESLIKSHGRKYDLFLQYHVGSPEWFGQTHESIPEMAFSTFRKALFNGYEVELEFKVDDWVHYDNGVDRGHDYATNQVKGIDDYGFLVFSEDKQMHSSDVRHATPEEIAAEKERRWWAKHDRYVNEYKLKDIIINCDGYVGTIAKVHENGGIYDVLFGVKDCISDSLSFHYSDLKIICFAEDRKDVAVNE